MGNCCGCSRRFEDSSNYHEKELQSNTFQELSKFTFCGLITKAKIVSVYDGDTVTLVFYYHNIPIKDSFRMLGYDSPELKPVKTIENRELHIHAGRVAKEYLSSKILDHLVWVKFSQEEKYGRLMGTLYYCHEGQTEPDINDNINAEMILKGYGKPYDGGHKSEFTKNELQKIVDNE